MTAANTREGCSDDERHPQHAFVDEQAVRALAMLAEALPVIADDHDDRAIQQSPFVQERQHAAELRVDKRNFAEVRIGGIDRPVRLGRLVRRVRVVEVEPGEEASAACWYSHSSPRSATA